MTDFRDTLREIRKLKKREDWDDLASIVAWAKSSYPEHKNKLLIYELDIALKKRDFTEAESVLRTISEIPYEDASIILHCRDKIDAAKGSKIPEVDDNPTTRLKAHINNAENKDYSVTEKDWLDVFDLYTRDPSGRAEHAVVLVGKRYVNKLLKKKDIAGAHDVLSELPMALHTKELFFAQMLAKHRIDPDLIINFMSNIMTPSTVMPNRRSVLFAFRLAAGYPEAMGRLCEALLSHFDPAVIRVMRKQAADTFPDNKHLAMADDMRIPASPIFRDAEYSSAGSGVNSLAQSMVSRPYGRPRQG